MTKESKILTVTTVVKLIGAIVTILAAYFVAEMAQNTKIAVTTETLDAHLQDSRRTFENFNTTLREQRVFNMETTKVLERVSTIQRAMKEETYRFSEDAKKTSLALKEMSMIQRTLKEENGRLARSIEELKRNP